MLLRDLSTKWHELWAWLDPSPMDWLNLSVAILLSAIPILLMWIKHPKIEIEFDERITDQARGLECKIFNRPVSRVLRFLRVRRAMAEEVMANVEIRKSGSNDVIVPFYRSKIYTGDNDGAGRVQLSPSLTPVWFFVTKKVRESAQVISYPGCDPRDTGVDLPPGKYTAFLRIKIEGTDLNAKRNFVVMPNDPYVYWSNL